MDKRATVYKLGSVPSLPRIARQPHEAPRSCDCMSFTLGGLQPEATERSPSWLATPGWDPSWTAAEIRQEECRRLVWCVHQGATGQTVHYLTLGLPPPDYFVTDPFNVRELITFAWLWN